MLLLTSIKKPQATSSLWTRDFSLLLYEARVVYIMMYNSSCWAAPKSVLEKIDVFHGSFACPKISCDFGFYCFAIKQNGFT